MTVAPKPRPLLSRWQSVVGATITAALLAAALGVIVVSFLQLERERIDQTRRERLGLAFQRPAERLLARLVRARTVAARAYAHDARAARAYPVARRRVLAAMDAVAKAQRKGGRALGTGTDVNAMERQLAVLLPRKPTGGMEDFRAYGALTDAALALIGDAASGAGLDLDPVRTTYALSVAGVEELPTLMDATGRAAALRWLMPRAGLRPASPVQIEVTVLGGGIRNGLRDLNTRLGQGSVVDADDALSAVLQQPLRNVSWSSTSLLTDLTASASGGRRGALGARAASAPAATARLWSTDARELDARLRARAARLERRKWEVEAAVTILLLLALGVSLVIRISRRRSEALARELHISDSRLHETQARFGALVERLPTVTYVLEDDRITYISPQVAAVLGYEPAEWLTDPGLWRRRLHSEDRGAALEHARRLAEGRRTSQEYRMIARDGHVVWVSDEAAPVHDESGRLLCIQGVLLDVTERRRILEERDRMERELHIASKLEAVGQLAAGVAHEINTPMQFVGDSIRFLHGAFGDLMELVGDYRAELAAAGDAVDAARIADAEDRADLEYLEERVPGAFDRSFDGVERVTTIVSAMKTFSHTGTVEKAPADLNDAVRTTLVVCRNEYKYLADVETDLGVLPPVVCLIGQLNQVFLNLIVNAAHAIEDVGGGERRGRIAVRTAREDDDAVIAVSDTGGGIPADVRERIFEPFFTTKEVGRGSGQGLALARSIVVDQHGGSIEVDTTPGVGTTFTVRVPLDPTRATGAGPSATDTPPAPVSARRSPRPAQPV